MNFRVSELAREEIVATARWYDTQPSRHGSAFLDEIEIALTSIANDPRFHPMVEDGVEGCEIRELFISRFQQRVIFLVTDDEVAVISIIHAPRREGRWLGNLPEI